MTNWDAVETAATATRRLNNALTGWRASDETLTTAAEVINNIAERIEAGTPRVKLDDMMTRPHLARIYAGQHTPLDLDDGDEIEFDPFSVAGGAFHPSSVGVRFHRESAASVIGTVTITPMFAGPPERVHGGIQSLIVDEVMGALNRMLGRQAFTARLTVNLRAPAPLNVELRFRAWVDNVDGRKITIRCTGESPDGMFLESDGLFIARKDEEPGADAKA
jgi:acyl-coenzyme A thioesterase PaaI-like protein